MKALSLFGFAGALQRSLVIAAAVSGLGALACEGDGATYVGFNEPAGSGGESTASGDGGTSSDEPAGGSGGSESNGSGGSDEGVGGAPLAAGGSSGNATSNGGTGGSDTGPQCVAFDNAERVPLYDGSTLPPLN